jgi:hypothetical protein
MKELKYLILLFFLLSLHSIRLSKDRAERGWVRVRVWGKGEGEAQWATRRT